MRKFEIYFNDNAFYGEVSFEDDTPQEEIEAVFQKEIERNNKTPNPNYRISRSNFKEC